VRCIAEAKRCFLAQIKSWPKVGNCGREKVKGRRPWGKAHLSFRVRLVLERVQGVKEENPKTGEGRSSKGREDEETI